MAVVYGQEAFTTNEGKWSRLKCIGACVFYLGIGGIMMSLLFIDFITP